MSNTVPLSLELCQSIAELSLEHRTGVVNVGSQSADTIKLDFSSCSGRKQNVSADLSQRPFLLLLQPPAVRHQACAHCPSVLLVRFSATPRMMERAGAKLTYQAEGRAGARSAQEVVAELAAYMLVDADRNFASL